MMQLWEVSRLNISSDILYGYADLIILRCLLEGDSYGYEINNTILAKSERRYELKEANLYTQCHRLEKQGYVRSYWGSESEGARRRYYAITEAGKAYYKERKAAWEAGKGLLDALIR